MRRLAARKSFDFSRYDPTSATSRAALQRAINEEARQSQEIPALVNIITQVAMVIVAAIRQVDGPKLEERLDTMQTAVQSIWDLHLPWVKHDDATAKPAAQDTYQQLYDQWTALWGDPSDPAVQANIKKTADWLQQSARAGLQRRGGSRGLMQ